LNVCVCVYSPACIGWPPLFCSWVGNQESQQIHYCRRTVFNLIQGHPILKRV